MGGYGLWAATAGSGPTTVVFISGNGADSGAWTPVEPAVREKGFRTLLYDRAGLGRSSLDARPYKVEDEAEALETLLAACGVEGPVVLVAHSYGGLIASLVTENRPQIRGLVAVDALLPEDMTDRYAEAVLAVYTPQFAAVEAQAPELAKAVIPVVRAYPDTARRLRRVAISPDLPVIDIVAEHGAAPTPEDQSQSRAAHAAFVATSSQRTAVFAEGSSHNVMRDRPELVIAAISDVAAR